jgi:uncharacterized protein (DUF1810 family)
MPDTEDPHDLRRFVEAQNEVLGAIRSELRAGRKRSHWLWFTFPQVAGLGGSPTSQKYAISSRAEAEACLDHPALGSWLYEFTALVNDVEGRTVNDVFGSPDGLKFRSSMTLFEAVAEDLDPFATALERYYDGDRDDRTLELLEG